jgi:hypothetical protein
MALIMNHTHQATVKPCLALPDIAKNDENINKKSPQLRGLKYDLVPVSARRFRLGNHSHSIVAGGLPEIS